jgi:hypothetical protein
MFIDDELQNLKDLDLDETQVIEEDSFEVKLARLVLRQVPDATICQIYQLTKSELKELTTSTEFAKAAQQAGEELHVVPVELDTTWDDIERTSLKRLKTELKTGYMSASELLSTASAANRATRKGDSKKSESNEGAGTNRITLEFSGNFMKVVNNLNIEQRNAELTKLGSTKKMVDYLNPKDFEKFVDEKVAKPSDAFFAELDSLSIDRDIALDE